MIKTISEDAGFKGITPHSFRRTFATNYYLKTKYLKTLKMLMGHSSIKTTDRYIIYDNSYL